MVQKQIEFDENIGGPDFSFYNKKNLEIFKSYVYKDCKEYHTESYEDLFVLMKLGMMMEDDGLQNWVYSFLLAKAKQPLPKGGLVNFFKNRIGLDDKNEFVHLINTFMESSNKIDYHRWLTLVVTIFNIHKKEKWIWDVFEACLSIDFLKELTDDHSSDKEYAELSLSLADIFLTHPELTNARFVAFYEDILTHLPLPEEKVSKIMRKAIFNLFETKSIFSKDVALKEAGISLAAKHFLDSDEVILKILEEYISGVHVSIDD